MKPIFDDKFSRSSLGKSKIAYKYVRLEDWKERKDE
jgi:hypothetical protein